MRALGWASLASGAALAALVLSPVLAATTSIPAAKPRVSLKARGGLGSFTPATSDPRLAALVARGGLAASGFRFTPAGSAVRLNRSLTVAVRARSDGASASNERAALVSPPVAGIAPIAYNLGVGIGWKRFALSGDLARVDLGALGGREKVDLGVSYNMRRWSARAGVGADRPVGSAPRSIADMPGYSVDLGGSYALTRRIDLTAGVRYRAVERDRLQPLADDRRDSQAVYVGTAFKF